MAVDSSLTIQRLPGNAPGTVILRLTGEIILGNVLPLRTEFRNGPPPPFTILDMSGVRFLDSAGMSEIINHEVYCRDNGVRMALAGVAPRVLHMLQITRLDKVLTLVPTVEAAEARA
jgi:anti-sigma B factor antagonist